MSTLCTVSLAQPSVDTIPDSIAPGMRAHSPAVIFGHDSVTAFHSNAAAFTSVSTVVSCVEYFGTLDVAVTMAEGHLLLMGRCEQLKVLLLGQNAVLSGIPLRNVCSPHIIPIIPPRLNGTDTQVAFDILSKCYANCLLASNKYHVTILVLPFPFALEVHEDPLRSCLMPRQH